MRTPSPRQIVLYTSLAVALMCFGSLFLAGFILNVQIPIIYTLVATLVVLGISFVLYSFTLERFIHNKIKIIYKTIGKPRKFYREIRDSNKNIIKTVEHDVAEWAINKNKQIRELQKLETYRREFVGNVSHELKTPIFNAQGFIDTLLDGGLEDERINKKYLRKAADNLDRLENIVKDLEDISKLESGQLQLEKSAFDMWNLCKETIGRLEILAMERRTEINLQGVKEPLMVWADKDRVIQIMTNLLSNSIKYGHEGGIVNISFYDLDEQILIEVSDNGPGIDEKDLPRLFERFFRADKGRSRNMGGTGLGLAIVKNIIVAHEQTINVRSELGVGTTFSFTLEKYLPDV